MINMVGHFFRRLWNGKNSSLAEERGQESEGRSKRKRSSKLQGGNTKTSSEKRRQSSKGELSGKNGEPRDQKETAKEKPTRLLLSLKAWGASSKADARAKARAISRRNKAKKARA